MYTNYTEHNYMHVKHMCCRQKVMLLWHVSFGPTSHYNVWHIVVGALLMLYKQPYQAPKEAVVPIT